MLKSFVLRIVPSLMLVVIVKGLVGAQGGAFTWLEVLALAFVWTSIHKFLGKRTSMTVIEWSLGVAVVSGIIVLSSQASIVNKIVIIGLCIYLGKTAISEFRKNEIRNKDRLRSKKFLLYNVYDVRRLYKFLSATYNILNSGAKSLGREIKPNYVCDGPLFADTINKISDMGYKILWTGVKRCLVLGRDGLVVIRLLTEAGDYEFKKDKWYKDGKRCTDISNELKVYLGMLSSERGTNKAIIVKTFEGGSVKGAGCGFYITDITKGDERLVQEIQKTTRVENFKDRADKKSDRVLRALSIA